MRISLRLKLALITLLLLAIPYMGMHLSSIVQANLLESRRESLMFSARAVASALSGREGLFDQERFHALDQRRDLYLYELTSPMRLNGKTDDWQPHINDAQYFGEGHILNLSASFDRSSSGFYHQVGRRGKHLYAIFLVADDTIVFRKDGSLALTRSDHLQIAIEDRQGNLNRYIVAAEKPGWVNGFQISQDFKTLLPARRETRIQGVLLTTAEGYVLELRLPLEMVGERLAFAIGDVDNHVSGEVETLIGTASIEKPEKIGWLLEKSTIIQDILQTLNRPQSKIQIVDSNQHVRASFGSLKKQSSSEEETHSSALTWLHSRLSPLYRLFTEPFTTEFFDPKTQPATLHIAGVREALQGSSSISSYRIAEGEVEVMAAVTPLYEDDRIVGAVVVEQTTNSILALKNQVIQESIGLTLVVLVFGGAGLLLFAFRISSRIRQLRDQASGAIGENGEIGIIGAPMLARDEIGDLSRTLHSMLSQLRAQNQYREKMADNLEHEMRTPLASVSASLKNLSRELGGYPAHLKSYVDWALGDVQRLEDLLTAIRDATNLETALQQGFKDRINLAEALSIWLSHGWRKTFQNTRFVYQRPDEEIHIQGDPDRIRQMLDKLIENSVFFHTKNTPIELHLEKHTGHCLIKVVNRGSHIAKGMEEEIFNSMVSSRASSDNTPHLGLGLFVVRTIAIHHGGSVKAENLFDQPTGVCFTVRLPLHKREDTVVPNASR